MKSTLTDRQERFVHEYLIDHNASAAAVRSGYSAKTRGAQAAELMANPKVRERIVFEQGELFSRLKVHAAELLLAHVRAAYFDPAKLFDKQQQPVPLDQLDADTRGALTVNYDQRSNGDWVRHVRQTPRHIALAALQKRYDQWQALQAEMLAALREEEAPAATQPAFERSPIGQPQPDLGRSLFNLSIESAAPPAQAGEAEAVAHPAQEKGAEAVPRAGAPAGTAPR
ncbi:MAG TPA: terminase small subunit, partial [Burkholderiales bacterium]|nr:terminase small subunit [Burkholderiales bacterium]